MILRRNAAPSPIRQQVKGCWLDRHPALLSKRAPGRCRRNQSRMSIIDLSASRLLLSRSFVLRQLDSVGTPARSRASRLTHARSARSRIVTWLSPTAPARWASGTSTHSASSTVRILAVLIVLIVLTLHDDGLHRT